MIFLSALSKLFLVVAILGGATPSLAATLPTTSIVRFQKYEDCSYHPSSDEISRPSITAATGEEAYRECERECRRQQPDCFKFTASYSASPTSATTYTWKCTLFTASNTRSCGLNYRSLSGKRLP